jgi:hypothetical protein
VSGGVGGWLSFLLLLNDAFGFGFASMLLLVSARHIVWNRTTNERESGWRYAYLHSDADEGSCSRSNARATGSDQSSDSVGRGSVSGAKMGRAVNPFDRGRWWRNCADFWRMRGTRFEWRTRLAGMGFNGDDDDDDDTPQFDYTTLAAARQPSLVAHESASSPLTFAASISSRLDSEKHSSDDDHPVRLQPPLHHTQSRSHPRPCLRARALTAAELARSRARVDRLHARSEHRPLVAWFFDVAFGALRRVCALTLGSWLVSWLVSSVLCCGCGGCGGGGGVTGRRRVCEGVLYRAGDAEAEELDDESDDGDDDGNSSARDEHSASCSHPHHHHADIAMGSGGQDDWDLPQCLTDGNAGAIDGRASVESGTERAGEGRAHASLHMSGVGILPNNNNDHRPAFDDHDDDGVDDATSERASLFAAGSQRRGAFARH